MTKKVYVVTDLGPGDGGKGGVVHKLATMMRPHTIIKVGGAQGSHGVRTSNGESFAFSQWGCGTFEGVRTHISPRLVMSPEGLLNEAAALRHGPHGIHNPFALLTVDERAVCATAYHGLASRLKELARRDNPRGTIGTGVGEAYRDWERVPELVIRAGDLSKPGLRDTLAAVREHIRKELLPLISAGFLPADQVTADREIERLVDDRFLDYVVTRFRMVAEHAKIVDANFLRREILPQEGVVVVESSHGILTDKYHGFSPHTSALRTLPRFTRDMLTDAGYAGQVVNLGVCRAYQIRHGAGPMPTADASMNEQLLPGSHKDQNRWQGQVRVGPLDLALLRYALAASVGTTYDGLAITWFDQVATNREWRVCHRYQSGTEDPTVFSPTGEIKVRIGEDDAQLAHQELVGQRLKSCRPEISTLPLPHDTTPDRLFELCAGVVHESLKVPVRMISLGPTEKDKICK